jgi:LEA14-like dessication related protein
MTIPRLIGVLVLACVQLALEGCATPQGRDPLQVTVASIEPLEGEGMELRMLVKLRVQNPNDAPIDYNGVALEMIVQGKTFATGVSDATGTVPRFGESVIPVPVTASAFRLLSEAFSMMQGGSGGTVGPITYEMKGKLNGPAFDSVHFQTKGQLDLPAMGGSEPET